MISAVILTWNSDRYISKCLDSLITEFKNNQLKVEILVVDNGSTDKTLEILDEYIVRGQIKLISLDKNTGTTYSRNLAIREARGDFVLILDSDTRVKPGAIKKLLEGLNKDKQIGVIAPRLFYGDGSLQLSFKKFPTIQGKLLKAIPLEWAQKLASKLELYDPRYVSKKLNDVDYCISACWLLPKRVIDEVGLLDERIFYAPEDVDYCLRVWLAGYRVVYCPSAEVVHHTQRVSYKDKRFAMSHLGGLFYFFNKHRYWFSRRGIYSRIDT